MTRRLLLSLVGGALLAAAATAAPAGPEDVAPSSLANEGNVPYDGRFTFVRLRYRLEGRARFGGYTPPWAHDYPRAERNLMRIVDEITLVHPYLDGGNVLDADDPELHKYPFAYLSEPGFWLPSPEEVLGLRSYLLKGGFLVVDDFRGGDIENFAAQIGRVLPGARLEELDVSHPVFQTFFPIESLEFGPPTFRRFTPVYYGIFENNDRNHRLLAVVNYNNDIGDYWEFSDTDWMPVDLSNEAYKLGINYVVFAMTH